MSTGQNIRNDKTLCPEFRGFKFCANWLVGTTLKDLHEW